MKIRVRQLANGKWEAEVHHDLSDYLTQRSAIRRNKDRAIRVAIRQHRCANPIHGEWVTVDVPHVPQAPTSSNA
jgi:hypothetical protein